MIRSMPSFARGFGSLLCVTLGLWAAAAHGATPDRKEWAELNAASYDEQRAGEAVPKLRRMLATDLDAEFVPIVRQVLLRALLTSRAPSSELLGAVDTLVTVLPANDRTTGLVSRAQVALRLSELGEKLDRARSLAEEALAGSDDSERFVGFRSSCHTLLGDIALKTGDAKRAVEMLSLALPTSPDSQKVLFLLGAAHEKLGKHDLAIDAYVRSLGVFAGKDTSAAIPLMALHRKRNGDPGELAARIAAAKRASLQVVALDSHRHEGPAPDWKLPNFAGETIESASFKGKVVVVDFWGSWCGPCRAELPLFQEMYERYKDRGVEFVGINWEQAKTKEAKERAAKSFFDALGFTFPVVLDHDRVAVEAYQLEGFPTVFLIDQKGQMRYRNVGFNDKIDEIMAAQIESLLEKQP